MNTILIFEFFLIFSPGLKGTDPLAKITYPSERVYQHNSSKTAQQNFAKLFNYMYKGVTV